jgi:hypothetical protein
MCRLVSTAGGGYSILGAALGPTAWFRHAGWVHVQMLVAARADAAWAPLVYVSGNVALANRRVALLPRRFYVLAAARTSGGTDDAHSLARVSLDCAPAGWRPDAHAPWLPPVAPPPAAGGAPKRATAAASMGGAVGALAGGAALALATLLLLRRRRAARRLADKVASGPLLPLDASGIELVTQDAAAAVRRTNSWTLVRPEPGPAAFSTLGAPPPPPAAEGVEEPGGGTVPSAALRTFGFDVFLSYRRLDGRLVDAVQDKLLLNKLRVFKDVNGHMAGRPFDVELFRVIRDSAVFAPVLTLEGMRRLAALTPDVADFTLAEYVTALYFFEAGDIPLVYPLAVGAESLNAQGKPEWDKLFDSVQFKAYRDRLPDVVPTATLNLVNSVFLKILGHSLPDTFRTLTVREVMLGRAGDAERQAIPGLFSFDLFFLMCLQEDLTLHIEGRFAKNIRSALALAERRGWRRRVRDLPPEA